MQGLRVFTLINDVRHPYSNMIGVMYRVKGRDGGKAGQNAGEPGEGSGKPRADRGSGVALVSRERLRRRGSRRDHARRRSHAWRIYGHFGSKDDLAAEAVTHAVGRSTEKLGCYATLGDLVAAYLSERHCADRANGCAIAALGADIARQSKGVRHALTTYVRAQLDHFTRLLKSGAAARRRRHAIATLAGMVGALTLARAVDDPALSKEILDAARDAFAEARPPD